MMPSCQWAAKIRGGRSVERLTDRRRERGDGPLSFDRRLAQRRGVGDSVRCDREDNRGQAGSDVNEYVAGSTQRPALQKRGDPGLARLSLVSASARS